MNPFDASVARWHHQYLQGLDGRQQVDQHGDATKHRLSLACVSVIADAGMMVPVLNALEHLGLGRLAVTPFDSAAQAVLSQHLKNKPGSAIPRRVFTPSAFTVSLHGTDLVAVALTRPHPKLLAAINAIAVRHALPLCPVVLDGACVELGPTVLPGITACCHCADVRRTANAAHAEEPEAQRHFYDRNPAYEPPGRFDSLARVAGLLLGLEINTLIGGTCAPHAASRLVTYDLTANPKSHRFVPYYEWCDVCRPSAGPDARSGQFESFLKRRAVELTGSAS